MGFDRRQRPLGLSLVAAALLLILLGGCRPQESEPPATMEETSRPERGTSVTVNRLVYVGLDGHIYTVNPDGSDGQRISTPGERGTTQTNGQPQPFYSWPTWSPDDEVVSYSQVLPTTPVPLLTLLTRELAVNHSQEVYTNPPHLSSPLGPGIPYYTLW